MKEQERQLKWSLGLGITRKNWLATRLSGNCSRELKRNSEMGYLFVIRSFFVSNLFVGLDLSQNTDGIEMYINNQTVETLWLTRNMNDLFKNLFNCK